MSGQFDHEKMAIEHKIEEHRRELKHVEGEVEKAKGKIRDEEKDVLKFTGEVNRIMREIHDEEKRLMDIRRKEMDALSHKKAA